MLMDDQYTASFAIAELMCCVNKLLIAVVIWVFGVAVAAAGADAEAAAAATAFASFAASSTIC